MFTVAGHCAQPSDSVERTLQKLEQSSLDNLNTYYILVYIIR
jgi:hypothetical protein